MNTITTDPCCLDLCERKEVVVIGNGPSAIVLSYLLSGHVPYWNGCPVSNDYLNIKLEQYVKDTSLLEQDFEFLSDGLEGRSRNPVSLLIDNLLHPDADLGAHLQSKIKWRHDPSLSIDHLCIGRGGIGGVWNQLTSKQLQTISMADWMELPNYSMSTFRQQRRSCRCNNSLTTNENQCHRATYDEVHSYYMYYVKRNRLTNYFRNGHEITSIERVCIDAPYYDDLNEEIHAPEPLWEIRGYNEQNKNPFVIHAKYVVLATGMPQKITRSLGIIGEQASQSFTYTTLHDIEEIIINKKQLTSHSKPLLVVGCGLTAVDVLLLCQQYSIPVLHVFRRTIDDHELVLNQLPANVYPEYERIRELIRHSISMSTSSSSSSSSSSSQWSYQCYPQSEILSITEDGTVHIRNLRTQTTTEYDISYVARVTGADVTIPFLPSLTAKKNNGLHIDPYTYECIDFENVYALGPLAGDKLVRFLQGGALACAASLFKKHRQASSNNKNSRLLYSVTSRARIVA
ncbi:unnamed protein product [Rotaria sp. Silwood2]|nr:unnamed protein product [Rotaria sp. Silwood2]CAF4196914.1 unnamed protein product [Rotaria sp. Silwood2]